MTVQRNRQLVAGILGLALLLLSACTSTGWPTDSAALADRPAATTTPSPQMDGSPAQGGLLKLALPTSTPVPAGQAGSLTTEEQLAQMIVPTRDLRDLALRLDPLLQQIPAVVNAQAPDYQVGDRLLFWVHDLNSNRNFQIMAELIHRTDVAYTWAEVDKPHDAEAIARSIDVFSQSTYPALTAFFGSEWKPGVDNDPRVHVLHSTGIGAGVAGYYSSADQYSQLARPFSNEKEMFYINLDWLNTTRNFEYYETVLAHEFQHMIHWHQDRNEETWVNEGLSEFAQEAAGYPPDTAFARQFAGVPDTQLNSWNEVSSGNGEHYGSAYLFMVYTAQRLGVDFLQALVAHPANGIAGFDALLAGRDGDGPHSFDDLFADWVVANYADDPNALGLDGVYGYRAFEQPPPTLDRRVEQFTADTFQSTVNNHGVDYVLLEGEGDVSIAFDGLATTRLTATQTPNGRLAWWSNRGDDSNSRLTRPFDLSGVTPGTPVEMTAQMWWHIEPDYDYGYVLVSQDGRKWDAVTGARATEEDPTGNSFAPGYTGRSVDAAPESDGWVTEQFDLSPYAGQEIWVRFEYVTDDAVNNSGWLVDDVRIPAIGYAADFESGADGWESEGWLLTDNRLRQRWLLQVLEMEDQLLQGVRRIPVDENGQTTFTLTGLGDGRTAVLAISALAPVTTEPAAYGVRIDPQ